ncbi:MAG: peptidylprolyl isomerase [candidate division Zixibacteria bacterium]|nr:peptidylprolyl isomerase [candidate division Zixibacteria bacterium]
MADSLRSDSVLNQILIYGALDPEYIIRREAAVIYREHLGEDRSGAIAPAGTRYSERKVERALLKYVQNPSATIITEKGEIELRLLFDIAPLTVMNFIELADDGFYDGLVFHRVVPNFVVQGGDPRGDGWGGPPYFIRCEYSDRPYKSGTVGIATSGKDTGGSQFFITHSPQPHLNARYTVFGQVLTGMDVANELVQGDVIQRIIIHEE